MEDTLECARCSARILDGEMVVRDHGDWLHVRCVRVLASEDRVRLLESAQERIERTHPLAEPPAVLCVICGTGIAYAEDVSIGPSGPAHTRCRPESA